MNKTAPVFFPPDIDEIRNLERELFELISELGTESDFVCTLVFEIRAKLTELVKVRRQADFI